MHPALLFLLAILTPFLLTAALLAPPYLGITASAYIAYMGGEGPHPLADKLFDVFYIIDVYSKLFSYWNAHRAESDFIGYTLPVLVFPLAGILSGLWLARKASRKMMDVFHLSVGH